MLRRDRGRDLSGTMVDGERIIFEEPEQPTLTRSLTTDEAALSLMGPDGDGEPSPQSSRRATILVVDDNEIMRTLLTRVLERAGFEVIVAVDGQQGLERFCERTVQLVLTDVVMPRMDGIQLIHAIISRRPDARIVAISGVDDRAMRMAVELGIRAALRTPVTAAELLATVRRVLDADN